MRNKIFTIPAFKATIQNKDIERFLPEMTFLKPTQLRFDPLGNCYLLEFGSKWIGSDDGTLSLLEYRYGDMPPVANIEVEPITQAFEVTLSGTKSKDPDGGSLEYVWTWGDSVLSKSDTLVFKSNNVGVYALYMEVKDQAGQKSVANVEVQLGNTPPEVNLEFEEENYWLENRAISYKVRVRDAEDGKVHTLDRKVFAYFMPGNYPFGFQSTFEQLISGKKEKMFSYDCYSCHTARKASAGPAFADIAQKYYGQYPACKPTLVKKIIQGGNGNWGDSIMSAHPQLHPDEAAELVDWIFALTIADSVELKEDKLDANMLNPLHINGDWMLKATYTDKATASTTSNTRSDFRHLRSRILNPLQNTRSSDILIIDNRVRLIFPTSYVQWEGVRLHKASGLRIRYAIEYNGKSDSLQVYFIQKDRKTMLGSMGLWPESRDKK